MVQQPERKFKKTVKPKIKLIKHENRVYEEEEDLSTDKAEYKMDFVPHMEMQKLRKKQTPTEEDKFIDHQY